MAGTSNVGLIGVTLFADSTKFAQNMRAAAKETKDFMKAWRSAVTESGGGAISDRGALDTIKRQVREINDAAGGATQSGLKQFVETFRRVTGAGVLALFGSTAANVTTRIQELRHELASGKTNVGAMTVEIAEAIPILGGFATAIKEIAIGSELRKLTDDLAGAVRRGSGQQSLLDFARQLKVLNLTGTEKELASVNIQFDVMADAIRAAAEAAGASPRALLAQVESARALELATIHAENARKESEKHAAAQKRLNDDRAKFVQTLRDEADQLSEIQKMRRESERLGLAADPATQALIVQVARTRELKEAMAEANSESERLWSRAQQLIDETATPTERLRKELAEIAKLREQSFIGDETESRARDAAMRRFRDASGDDIRDAGGGLPAGLDFGGAGAIAAEGRFIAGQNQGIQIDRDQLRQLEKVERLLNTIERNTRTSSTAASAQGFP